MIAGSSTESTGRPRVWTVIVALCLALVANLGVGFLSATGAIVLITRQNPGAEDLPAIIASELPHELMQAHWLAVSILLLAPMLMAIAVAVGALSPDPLMSRLGLRNPRPPSRLGRVALSIACFAGGLSMSATLDVLGIHVATFDGIAQATFDAGTRPFLILLVGGGILAPIAEELIFRGAVQTRLVARFGAVVGVGVTSLAFGLFHLDPAHAAFATALGVLLGVLRQYSGTITLPIVVHMGNNLCSFGIARVEPPAPVGAPVTVSMMATAGALFAVTAIATVSFLMERRRERDAAGAALSTTPSVIGAGVGTQ